MFPNALDEQKALSPGQRMYGGMCRDLHGAKDWGGGKGLLSRGREGGVCLVPYPYRHCWGEVEISEKEVQTAPGYFLESKCCGMDI